MKKLQQNLFNKNMYGIDDIDRFYSTSLKLNFRQNVTECFLLFTTWFLFLYFCLFLSKIQTVSPIDYFYSVFLSFFPTLITWFGIKLFITDNIFKRLYSKQTYHIIDNKEIINTFLKQSLEVAEDSNKSILLSFVSRDIKDDIFQYTLEYNKLKKSKLLLKICGNIKLIEDIKKSDFYSVINSTYCKEPLNELTTYKDFIFNNRFLISTLHSICSKLTHNFSVVNSDSLKEHIQSIMVDVVFLNQKIKAIKEELYFVNEEQSEQEIEY